VAGETVDVSLWETGDGQMGSLFNLKILHIFQSF
jgi:hypothetical protein